MEILISNNQQIMEIDENITNIIKKVIMKILEIEKILNDGEISINIVDNEEIKRLNTEHRKKAEATDVLSFPQFDNVLDNLDSIEYLVLGDIVISIEKVVSQAKEFNHSIEREFAYLMVHSMYHLLGFDHMKTNEKKIMRQKEEYILNSIQITR